jgi:hypothetical protein
MPEDMEVIFKIHVKPDSVEVDSRIGSDADDEALALCERLLDTVREFSRLDNMR